MNYLDLEKARDLYAGGGNVTEYLKTEFSVSNNTSEIIEIAYDLQAGSYTDIVTNNMETAQAYAAELSGFLNPHLRQGDTLLDIGTGELTTISLVCNKLDVALDTVFAFDISWSRLYKGLDFWNTHATRSDLKLTAFVADIKAIPLGTDSVDVVTSSHALEPNGPEVGILLKELFRVAKRKCVLFEPSYEMNSNEGKARMDRLGYIKDIAGEVAKLGGTLVEVNLIEKPGNSLNPTACFVIEPPQSTPDTTTGRGFCMPGTDIPLAHEDTFYTSRDTGLVFPVLKGIPVLKGDAAILATGLFG